MWGLVISRLSAGGFAVFAAGTNVMAQDVAQIEELQSPAPVKQAERSLIFTVPLVYSDRVFGDILIEISGQDSVSVDSASLQLEINNILNEAGQAVLDQTIDDRKFVDPSDLKAAGFDLEFDSGQLQLTLSNIKPDFLPVQTLGRTASTQSQIELKTIEPEKFSTYLNVTGNFDYDTRFSNETPDFFFDGATRIGPVVIEYEAALTDQLGGSYDFLRRSSRAVYDDPKSYRRYSAGDLRLNSLSILRTPQIGGIAVEKNRNIFTSFSSITRLAGQQIFLDNRSSVDVLINGEQFDSFQLDAGTYDLASLPVQQGSNDIQLRVRDSFGRQEVIDYNFFYESLELPAGEDEYSLGIGLIADSFGFEPNYSDEFAASGYYRRALSSDLIVGGAFQASEDTQLIGTTASVVPQTIPGVFDLEVALSNSSDQTGFAARAGYRYQNNTSLVGASQFSINVDYESSGFKIIDTILPADFDLLSVTATYSKSFNQRTFAVIGGNYLRRGGQTSDDYTSFVELNHRVTDRLGLTLGAEYGRATEFRDSFGVRAGFTMAIGQRTRASADYRSRTDSLRANISRGADNQVGAYGYDIGVSKFGDDTQADLQLEYNANRFEARADFTSAGDSIGGIFDDQRARLQIGTSIAYAGGSLGIGRPISNSFMLAKPHPALIDQGVVSARTLARGNYYARSGIFGAALQGDLSAYNKQNVQFDAADPVDGFDVGDGTVLIDPPFKSGYNLIVGTENYISVIGTLADSAGPVSLATGRVTAINKDDNLEELPFFTNMRGRFGLFGLAPGKSYEVILSESDRTFTITIPKEGSAVVRMGTITLPDAG